MSCSVLDVLVGLSFGVAIAVVGPVLSAKPQSPASESNNAASFTDCAPRSDAIAALVGRYGEGRIAMGLDDRGIVEVFASVNTGSWTVVLNRPDGMACFIAHGHFWDGAPDPVVNASPPL